MEYAKTIVFDVKNSVMGWSVFCVCTIFYTIFMILLPLMKINDIYFIIPCLINYNSFLCDASQKTR